MRLHVHVQVSVEFCNECRCPHGPQHNCLQCIWVTLLRRQAKLDAWVLYQPVFVNFSNAHFQYTYWLRLPTLQAAATTAGAAAARGDHQKRATYP
jgi:hypothetical protein